MRRLLPSLRSTVAATCLTVGMTACGGDEPKMQIDMNASTAEVQPAGRDDVKITSVDGALVLAVVRDSVVMQLSDSLRQGVQEDISREVASSTSGSGTDLGSQIGAAVAGAVGSAVKSAVGTAMGFRLRVPAREITDLRFDNGELRFRVEGGGMNFNTKSDGKHHDESSGAFTEADAQRFISAVRAAQARSGAAAQH